MSARTLAIPRECGATTTGNSGEESPPGAPRPGAARQGCALALATAGGAGFAPVAPGTFGAAVGVALYALLAARVPVLLVPVLLGVSAAGTWASGEAERVFGRHDDGRIVIDEVAGQLLALLPLAVLAPAHGVAPLPLLAGFVAFRAFDIAKPLPVRWAERSLPGGLGVMADDLVAGALAAAVVGPLAALGVFGVVGGAA